MPGDALDTFAQYQAYAAWHKAHSGQYMSYSHWLRSGKPEVGTKVTDAPLPRPTRGD